MPVRPLITLGLLVGCTASLLVTGAADASPRAASPCSSTAITSVTSSSDSFSVGPKKSVPVDLYVAVKDACASTTVSMTISSPGKTRTFTADKLDRLRGSGLNGASVDVTYYTVGIDLEPKLLDDSDAGTWTSKARLTTELGDDDTTGPSFQVRHASRTTFDASPEPVRKGKEVTLLGRLSVADWKNRKYVPHPHDELTLQWRTPGDRAFVDLTPLAVDDGGYWGSSFTMSHASCFRGAYAGSDTVAPVTSRTDCVKVR